MSGLVGSTAVVTAILAVSYAAQFDVPEVIRVKMGEYYFEPLTVRLE